ncbi:MAG: hypothetical protein ACYDC6_14890 [Acidobacteriaceae bacterium]
MPESDAMEMIVERATIPVPVFQRPASNLSRLAPRCRLHMGNMHAAKSFGGPLKSRQKVGVSDSRT